MGTTIIFQPDGNGHRLYYVRILTEAAVERGDHVVFVTRREVLASQEAKVHLEEFPGEILAEEIDDSMETLEQLSRSFKAELTVAPDGDRLAMQIGVRKSWRGNGELSLLVMRENAQPARIVLVTLVKQALRKLLLRRAAQVAYVRISYLKSAGWSGRRDAGVAIDPIHLDASPQEGERFRAAVGMAGGRYWFGVIGALAARKNIPMICEALGLLSDSNVGLLLAGEIDNEIQAEVEKSVDHLMSLGVPVIRIHRVLEGPEFDAAVFGVDCLVVAHSNEGPSGVLGKALFAGTRVVAAGAQSLKLDAHEHPESISWSVLRPHALAHSFEMAMGMPRLVPKVGMQNHDFTSRLL